MTFAEIAGLAKAMAPLPKAAVRIEPSTRDLHRGFNNCTPVILEKRMEALQAGYVFIGTKKHKANDPCGCGSKRKFKRCCESNVIRMAGALWFKPEATADTRRML